MPQTNAKEMKWDSAKNIRHGKPPIGVQNMIFINAKNACAAKTLNSIANTGPPAPFILSR